MNKKRKHRKDDEFEFDPLPKHLVTAHLKKQEKRLIIILEGAQLESVKVTNMFMKLFDQMKLLVFFIYFKTLGWKFL